MIHPLAGVLSAYGIGLADMRVVRERTVGVALGFTPHQPSLATASKAAAPKPFRAKAAAASRATARQVRR